MAKIQTIYLIHHCHTDVGYTHDQPILWDLQTRFLDDVLTTADQSVYGNGDAAFRWTVESTKALSLWLEGATSKQIDRFCQLEKDGFIEVTAMFANLTPLFDVGQLVESFQLMGRLRREYGFNIRSAMNCDVNGQNWPLVDILYDLGIEGFSMAINEHFGGSPMSRPNAFWWEGPSGRRLLAWNGWHYDTGWRYGIGRNAEEFENKWWPRMQQHLDQNDYPLSSIMIQGYHPFGDNATAYPPYSDFVERWNQKGNVPRIRMATLSEWWEAVKKEADRLPVHRGDWTDYWNFGCISSAREQAMNRTSRARLRVADMLAAALRGVHPDRYQRTRISMDRYRTRAWESLHLWDEHTWGADCSIVSPASEDTATQWHHKAQNAYTARSLSLLMQRDAIAELATLVERPADGGFLVYNPLPWPRTVSGPVSAGTVHPRGTADDHTSGRHYQDRAVYESLLPLAADNPWWWRANEVKYLNPIEIPPFGYAVVPTSLVTNVFDDARVSEDAVVETKRWRLTFDLQRGGITSWYDARLGREWVDQTHAHALNAFVHERVADKEGWPREQVCEPMHFKGDSLAPPRGWKPGWPAIREGSQKVLDHKVFETGRGIWVVQKLKAPGVIGVLTQLVHLPEGDEYIECESWWDMGVETHPEATYLLFPFDITEAKARYDVGGQSVIAGEEQLPGVCRDFYTAQQWVDFSNGDVGITVALPENPMVQFGDFSFGKNLQEFSLERSTLLGWVTNNYWETNFRAHQPGRVRARYRLFPYAGPFDEGRAHRFGSEATAHVPLVQHLGEPPHEESMLPQAASLLALPEPPVLTLHVKPDISDDGIVVRFLNATDEEVSTGVGSGALQIKRAVITNLSESNDLDDLKVTEGAVMFTIAPREMMTLRLWMSS